MCGIGLNFMQTVVCLLQQTEKGHIMANATHSTAACWFDFLELLECTPGVVTSYAFHFVAIHIVCLITNQEGERQQRHQHRWLLGLGKTETTNQDMSFRQPTSVYETLEEKEKAEERDYSLQSGKATTYYCRLPIDSFQMGRQNLWTGGQGKRKSPRCNEVYYHAKSNPFFSPPVQLHSHQLKGVYSGNESNVLEV